MNYATVARMGILSTVIPLVYCFDYIKKIALCTRWQTGRSIQSSHINGSGRVKWGLFTAFEGGMVARGLLIYPERSEGEARANRIPNGYHSAIIYHQIDY